MGRKIIDKKIAVLAEYIADEANKCCSRSDGYEEDIEAKCVLALYSAFVLGRDYGRKQMRQHIKKAYAE